LAETAPAVWLTVRDVDGNVVRRIKGPAKKGFHRVNWDLRYPDGSAVSPNENADNPPTGFLVAPGDYTVSLSRRVKGVTEELVAAKPFKVERLRNGALQNPPQGEVSSFWDEASKMDRTVTAMGVTLGQVNTQLPLLKKASERALDNLDALDDGLVAIESEVAALRKALGGSPSSNELWVKTEPTIRSRLQNVLLGIGSSTYGPTETHRQQFGYAQAELDEIRSRIVTLTDETVPAYEQALADAGAPWVPGSDIPRD